MVTVNVQVEESPSGSVTVQVTVVTPTLNVFPTTEPEPDPVVAPVMVYVSVNEAVAQQLSVNVGDAIVPGITEQLLPETVSATLAHPIEIAGAVTLWMVTVNVQVEESPSGLVTVQITVVTPTLKVFPTTEPVPEPVVAPVIVQVSVNEAVAQQLSVIDGGRMVAGIFEQLFAAADSDTLTQPIEIPGGVTE